MMGCPWLSMLFAGSRQWPERALAPSSAALTFGGCALMGAVPLVMIRPDDLLPLSVVAALFFGGGVLAGTRLGVGWIPAIGVGIPFTVGPAGAVWSLIGTQAMSGREGVLDVLPGFLLFYVCAYSIGAGAGLAPMVWFGFRVFVRGVLGFSLGAVFGALGVTSAAVWTRFRWFDLAVVASLVIPAAVGGAALAWGLRRKVPSPLDNQFSDDAV